MAPTKYHPATFMLQRITEVSGSIQKKTNEETSMNLLRYLLAASLTMLSAQAAHAVEGAIYGGPIGGTDFRNAYLPPPGLYGAYADVPAMITQYNGNNGGKSLTLRRINFSENVSALGLLYVYPFRIAGGSLGTSVQFSYLDYSRFSVDNITQRSSGWGDMYSDILKWNKYLGQSASPASGRRPLPYGLTVAAAYSMVFPIGQWQPQKFVTSGHNDYFFTPNVSVTYLTKPNFLGDGIELDGHLYYDHALENSYDHYRDGDIIDLDFAIGERANHWQYGLAGYSASQIGRDTESSQPVPVHGNYFTAIKVGPIAEYDIPRLGLAFKAKVQFPVYIKNAVFGPTAVLSVGFKIPGL